MLTIANFAVFMEDRSVPEARDRLGSPAQRDDVWSPDGGLATRTKDTNTMDTTRRKSRPHTVLRTAAAGGLAVCAGFTALTAPGWAATPSPRNATTTTVAPPTGPADVDVMFIGAHPDDEASRLSIYGQWAEDHKVRTGVITVTRGEGGGNAIGPEEGPALGLLREAEERRAVGKIGVTDVYNLDDVDFYYTVSEPLTAQAWSPDTLAKVVRVIRQTTPEILFTMDPAPSPGNHGNHQEAALLSLMAYHLAGDPTAFPEQITQEGLKPWAPTKIIGGARGTGTNGAACAATFTPVQPTQDIYGIWGGAQSATYGKSWAQVERDAQREYASQGWATWADAPADPNCDYFTQWDARVPFIKGDRSAAAAEPSAALRGALLVDPEGLPLGTGLDLTTPVFGVMPGASLSTSLVVTAPQEVALSGASVAFTVPTGWSVDQPTVTIGNIPAGESRTVTVRATVGANAPVNQRALVEATVTSAGHHGYTNTTVEVTPAVRGTQQLLPQVAQFQHWAQLNEYPQMEGFVKPVLSMPVGGTREITIDMRNYSEVTQAGTVSLNMPAGFSVSPAEQTYSGLAAGDVGQVTFTVTSTNPSQATSMQGGDYPYQISTTSVAGPSAVDGNIELVPSTAIPEVSQAPALDGVISASEYTTSVDISRRWEGEDCTSAADCSAEAHLARHGDDLYIAVDVTDDILGTQLDPGDCKRHWRTDAVEIAIDPQGNSENTSTTFKAFALPITSQGGGCFGRDADHHQGGPENAPGVELATKVTAPFNGYVMEMKIPATTLPQTIDPQHVGLNIFVYDSDTQNKTGQTRIGWSTWGGVQGDPYRWGFATFPGWSPPSVAATPPVIPSESLSSLDSPQTIDQAIRTGVALSGRPHANPASSAVAVQAWGDSSQTHTVIHAAGSATMHIFALDTQGNVVGSLVRHVQPGWQSLDIPTTSAATRVLAAAGADSGGSTASGVALTAAPQTAIQLTVDPNRPRVGQSISARIQVDGGKIPVVGDVAVQVDGQNHSTVTLADGQGVVDLGSSLPVGKHTLKVTYAAQGLLPEASTEITFEVTKAGTGTPAPPQPPSGQSGTTVKAPSVASPGQTITITVPDLAIGTELDVWLWSTPTWLGQRTVDAAHTVKVTIPLDATLGSHQLAIYDTQGALLGWTTLEVHTAPRGPLAMTGAGVGAMVGVALALLVTGGLLLRRRRRIV